MRHITRLLCLLALLLPACGQEEQPAAPTTDTNRIIFWNWPDYVTEDALRGFERETGIRVETRIFEDEEILMGAMQSSAFRGDVVVISDTSADEMIAAQLIAPLDLAKIPNAAHIEPPLRATDADPVHGVPYLAGTTGVIVNTARIPRADSWSVLWDESLKGRIAMLPSGLEIVPAASKKLGFPILPQTEAEFQAVRDALLTQRPLLRGYLSVDEIVERMVAGDLWAAQIYSGDALLARDRNPDLRYFVPREGCMIWTDKLMIPRSSRHKDQAMAFIDYLQRPEVMAKLSADLHSPTPNVAARKLLPPDVLADPDVYPPQDILERCEFFPAFHEGDAIMAQTAELWSTLNRQDE